MSGTETAPALVRLLDGWLAGTGITLLELRTPEESVRLLRAGDAATIPAPAAGSVASVTIASPGTGVFLDQHPLRAEPLAAPGQAVRAGDVVGLLQTGALLLHVLAPADGVVAGAVVPAGSMVGYGVALLRLQRRSAE